MLSGTGLVLLFALVAITVWPTGPAPRVIHRAFTDGPSPLERDSLAALAATGTTVSWSGDIPPVAMELDADLQAGSVGVAVAAPAGARVIASDRLGVLDSITVEPGAPGATLRLNGVSGALTVASQDENLRAVRQRPSGRSVAVFGPAGWETRFLMEALEAQGLPVTSRIRVGPQTFVAQGRPLPLDTGRHAVAVLLGPTDRATEEQIRRFVRAGGGVVLASGATGFDDIAPGQFDKALRPPASLSLPSERAQLVSRPIRRLSPMAVALDGPLVRTAARRVGAGRVIQMGDEDTWRLALASDAGRAAHIQLWLTAITLASPRDVARPAVNDEVAPRAAVVAALGSPIANGSAGLPVVDWEAFVAVTLLAALVGEWAVRRLRGLA